LKSKSNPVFQRLLSNWHAKVIALIASLFVFIFYRISTQHEVLIPLEIKLPDGYEIAREWPQNIRIIIRGGKSPEQLTKDDFKALADLASFTRGGEVKANVKVERLGDAVKLGTFEFDYSPTLIPFLLEQAQDKYVSIDVKAITTGSLPRGYVLESLSVTPQSVLLRGPKTQLESVTKVTTDKFDLSGKTESVSRSVKVLTNNKFVRPIDFAEINVAAVISEKREKRVVSDIDISFKDLRNDLVPRDAPKGKIEIEAALLFFDNLRKEQLQLVVDCGAVSEPGEYVLVPKPGVPPEAKIMSYEPDKLVIRFERK
jgi:YbbR domain-containing protein